MPEPMPIMIAMRLDADQEAAMAMWDPVPNVEGD
jgi:hypothetical protein